MLKMTGKQVKFCMLCSQTSCSSCDTTFDKNRRLQSTSFLQFDEDITTLYTKMDTEMIADIQVVSQTVIGDADF